MPGLSKMLWAVAAAKLALHLASSARGYGFFGDELYYIACAAHPAFGYVDHPPFSIWALAAWQGVVGDSLAALRLLPALLGASAVLVAGALARELGGRGSAQVLTAVVVGLAPVNLVIHGYYSMNAIDLLVWEIAFVGLARTLRDPTPVGWLGLGALLGIGLLNKISVLWLGAGLLTGLVLTPYRQVLRSPWPWIAGGLSALIFLPHILWQVAQAWPTAEFVEAATAQKMVPVPPLELFAQQALVWNPLVLPLWLGGFVALLRRRRRDPGRVFASVYVVTAAILIAAGTSKPNYLALAAPPLLAAGAIGLERAALRRQLGWLMPATTGLVLFFGLASAPLTVPLLPVADLVTYARAIQIGAPQMENREVGALDPHFADMFGWEPIVDSIAQAYHALPPDERERAAILGVSYGEASAVDMLGPSRGLPGAISGHNSYWLWGAGESDLSLVVIAGGSREMWASHWGRLEEAAVWDCGYCLPGRNHSVVWIAREPRTDRDEIWAAIRHYD